ncbi:MAG TPA: DEAD/DEAH box helicase [Terriglobales bacterium]|nr:DEAD/DEAH box helicase [Terriglobales bacterium]
MTTFSELPLSAALQQKLAAAQFTTLTPIQERAIAPALQGSDIIGTAQTGTGKTLAFLIPVIELLSREASRQPSVLVLLPTRELAMQVEEQYEQLRGNRLRKAALIVGGMSEKAQMQAVRSGVALIIATPGRLQDFINRNLVNLRETKILVLDEADRMLDMGFLPAIQRILAILPAKRQTLCFSATLEQSVARLVNDYMRQPVRIALGSVLKPAASVQLKAYEVRPGEKMDVLPIWIKDICVPDSTFTQCTGTEWQNNVDLRPKDVLADIAACNLANVSWVTPPYPYSDHPKKNATGGPSWVASIVNAVGVSTTCDSGAGYWKNTAILITWDDWGGWYDHEPPTILSPPTQGQGDYQYGCRVPLLVVSAYTPYGYVDNNRLDLGSILRFVERNFGITEGALNFADARATNDLTGFFNLSGPRAFQHIDAPLNADFFLYDDSPLEPPDDD